MPRCPVDALDLLQRQEQEERSGPPAPDCERTTVIRQARAQAIDDANLALPVADDEALECAQLVRILRCGKSPTPPPQGSAHRRRRCC